jgi:preprotein translocase subunit SecY
MPMADDGSRYNPAWVAATMAAFAVTMFAYNWWAKPTTLVLAMMALGFGFLFAILALMLSYEGYKPDGTRRSMLYGLKGLATRLPSVKKPDGHVHFRTKMTWLIIILILYFILTNVMIYGLDQAETVDLFESYRAIMAGAQGSLMHLGIGPIVTGSIIMQLFVGAKIINLKLTDDEDKAVYQSVQKLLVVVMIVVEAVPQVYGYLMPSDKFVGNMEGIMAGNGANLAKFVIVAQLCFGSYLVFLMDETVSKWGVGSGISLFIAAGVAESIFTGTLNWMPADGASPIGIDNPPVGTLPKTFYFFGEMSSGSMIGGGYERILIQPPNPIIALIGTLSIFFFVAYVESCRIELPLAHESARGARGRYPIRLI